MVEIGNKDTMEHNRLSPEPFSPVDFRNWVRLELGAMLSVLDITMAPSLISFLERIISKVDST
ncbi:hypothetical protein F4779DRAFT_613115 [Xylariaceae sp. FL0662B]|nr:hypothetical protein F4779DRAFT_613115 [Xylariaceae sp. FL0662B]